MEVKLGLGFIPRPTYLFVSNEQTGCWYFLIDDKKHVITEDALTGTITRIDFNKPVQTSMGEVLKIDIWVQADKTYVIRTGADSFFAKSFVMAIASLSAEQLKQPITIGVRAGEKKTVFCELYDPITQMLHAVSWDGYKEKNWRKLEHRCLELLGQCAVPEPKQPKSSAIIDTPASSGRSLFPQHNSQIAQIRELTGNSRDWIVKQCQRFGKNQPSTLAPHEYEELLVAVCSNFSASIGTYGSLDAASQSFKDSLRSYPSVFEATIAWIAAQKRELANGEMKVARSL